MMKNMFNNISLYKKISLVFSVTLTLCCAAYLLSFQYFTKRYDHELYMSNSNSLNHVSTSVSSGLKAVELISYNIIKDQMIQTKLRAIDSPGEKTSSARLEREIYQALYPYMFNNGYIKSIHILFDETHILSMGNSEDLDGFSLTNINSRAAAAQGRLNWYPSAKPSGNIVGSRIIRQMQFLNLKPLATLYIVVDLQKLIRDSLENAGHSEGSPDFILFDGQGVIYPEATQIKNPEGILRNLRSQDALYKITKLNGQQKFVIYGRIPYSGWEYLYFRDYSKLYRNLKSLRIQTVAIILIFFFGAILFIHLILRKIFVHLDRLIEKIQGFGRGKKNIGEKFQYDYAGRMDEIGQLHREFDKMTHSVKVLRDENYDKQLLLRDATIQVLQQQINPHFLYNTLDTINWMAHKHGAEEISVMTKALGNLFRFSISQQYDLVALKDELNALDNYIQIQKIRFRDRLAFAMQLPAAIENIFVPKLCIQPLVENAVKHALEYSDELCSILVSIEAREENIKIKVSNTGSQFEDNMLWKLENHQIVSKGSGVGLNNINSRLKLLYKEQYQLLFYNQEGKAIVCLTIPRNLNDEKETKHA